MNILITGCNGQLGNEMQLLQKEHTAHTYYNTDVQELDITNREAIEAFVTEHQIDGIVNCAAYTAVDKAEDNQELCALLNATAPGYLAEAIERRGGWFIQISTDYVFDGTNHTPYVETDPVCPNSTYGRTKLLGEQQAQQACRRTMIIRTAWLYSTFGNNFVKTMIRLGREKEQLGVIFDQIGTPTYARDLAVAIFAAIE
ncbi:MAG: sugar nucleotide-binding protein, partial [Prevotella sp.]|nr:sugar nucleotide-binding protein [Prevotella sp.]